MMPFRYHRFESNGTRFCRVCMLRADHVIHRLEPEWIRRAREHTLPPQREVQS